MVFGLEILIGAAVAAGVVGGCIGYWIALSSQKRAAGGKTLVEMHAEKEAYQENVAEHFKTTATLLHEMTDKYREVYRHMADGAQNLVTSEVAAPALAQLRGDLIAAEAHHVAEPDGIGESELGANDVAPDTESTADEEVAMPSPEVPSEAIAEIENDVSEASHSVSAQEGEPTVAGRSGGFFAEDATQDSADDHQLGEDQTTKVTSDTQKA